MEKVLDLRKEVIKENAITLAKFVAISIGVATLYLLITVATADLSSAMIGGNMFSFRLANGLRTLALSTPAGGIGVALGGAMFNMKLGIITLPTFTLLAFMHGFTGYIAYITSKRWGRSVFKDLTILGVYGAIMGLLVGMGWMTVGHLMGTIPSAPVVPAFVISKIVTDILSTWVGYGLIQGGVKLYKRK